jgi:hypothetical protein
MAKSVANDDLAFNYEARLTEQEIRVLEFVSSDTDAFSADDVLRLKLKTIPIPTTDSENQATTTPYLALSYTWGRPDPSKMVMIDDKPFHLGMNLFQVLTHLKLKIHLPIWIDAICINQADDVEKGGQVRHMGIIYRNAEQTIIWLGEGDSSIGPLFDRLEAVGKEAIEAGLWDLSYKDMQNWTRRDLGLPSSSIKNRLEKMMLRTARGSDTGTLFPVGQLVDLSFRPWFSRVWILQEITNSKDYIFLCGRHSIPGDRFSAGYQFINIWIANEFRSLGQGGSMMWIPYRIFWIWWRNGWPIMRSFLQRAREGKELILSARASTTLGTRRKFRKENGISLMVHLNRAFTLVSDNAIGATDPKDRVYGFLGISSDAEQLAIQPDYRRETGFQKVYAEVAKSLAQNGNLEILTLCRSGYSRDPPYEKTTRDELLPSWAPDWTKPVPRPWGGSFEDQLFHASGTTKVMPGWNVKQDPRPNLLNIKTRFVDTILEIGSVWKPQWNLTFDYNAANIFLTEVETFIARSGTRYSAEKRKEASWRIPIADQEFDALGSAQRATQLSSKSYDEMKSFISDPNRGRKFNTAVTYLSFMKDVHDARPFLSAGGYVGLCPDGSVAGDEIHIPLGLHVPVVVRKIEHGLYTLIGEGYAQGVMDGEMFETECEEQIISLV